MRHLTESEFVDLVDGLLPAGRAAHLTECEACRSEADAMRAVLSRAVANDVPDPSPLFWSHLSDNVRQAIAGQSIERAGWFGWLRAGHAWSAAAAVATLVLAAGIRLAMPTSPHPAAVPAAAGTIAPPAAPVANGTDTEIDDDIDADEAWALVRTVADDVPWDQTHEAGISARPGSAERIALQLTPAERRELARLLEDELRRRGA